MKVKGLIGESHANDEDLRLPRDMFRSRLQYEMVRHRVVLISLGFELAVFAFLFHLGLQAENLGIEIVIIVPVLMLAPLVVAVTGVMTYRVVRRKVAALANKLRFMKEIMTVKPGIEMREWDVIAARMNPVFYRSSSLVTPYFFYDGESCYSYFRSTYLQPYLNRKDENCTNVAVDDFQRILDQAIKTYEEKADEDWQRIMNGTSSLRS
ncbi:LANO_0D00364g1_1 [Lachancea nothofagi CBS 11611]|uniref:LANO_0D00364g1_1 n=1 Tax=Lachancea nothofagi CBS 11611 TaxID=1266666 RepID=A0A1G4JCM4_9SACH|nr:LANO_0D00364g1_1 [Lachancea nothofagi CBS 11611]